MLQFCSVVGGAIALVPFATAVILVAAVVIAKVVGLVRWLVEYRYFEPYLSDDTVFDYDIVLPDGKHLYSEHKKE